VPLDEGFCIILVYYVGVVDVVFLCIGIHQGVGLVHGEGVEDSGALGLASCFGDLVPSVRTDGGELIGNAYFELLHRDIFE